MENSVAAPSFISAWQTEVEKVNFIPGGSVLVWRFSRIPSSKGIFRLPSKQCRTETSESALSEADETPAAVHAWQPGAHLRFWGLSIPRSSYTTGDRSCGGGGDIRRDFGEASSHLLVLPAPPHRPDSGAAWDGAQPRLTCQTLQHLL